MQVFEQFPCSTCGTHADVQGLALQCAQCPPYTKPISELMQKIATTVRPPSEVRTPEQVQEVIDNFDDWMMDGEVLGDLPKHTYDHITDCLLKLTERSQTIPDNPTVSSFMEYVLNAPLPAQLDEDGAELPEPEWPKGQEPGSVTRGIARLPPNEEDSDDEEHDLDAAVIMSTAEFKAIHTRISKRVLASSQKKTKRSTRSAAPHLRRHAHQAQTLETGRSSKRSNGSSRRSRQSPPSLMQTAKRQSLFRCSRAAFRRSSTTASAVRSSPCNTDAGWASSTQPDSARH